MSGAYHFKTHWRLPAPAAAVYPIIRNAEAWPLWWPAVYQVHAFQEKNGTEWQRQHWRTPFGYSFSFELKLLERRPNQLLRAAASGMLEGTGAWHFQDLPGGCLVLFEWNVQTRVGWMNQMDWLLRPAFAYNHHLVMEQGRKGLLQLIGGSLGACLRSDATSPVP